MSAAHTPGPWVIDPGDSAVCIRANGERIAATTRTPYWKPFDDTDLANAGLIAAAPDMANDGQFLLDRLDEFETELLDDEVARQFFGHVAPAIARLRAAIAKATGAA